MFNLIKKIFVFHIKLVYGFIFIIFFMGIFFSGLFSKESPNIISDYNNVIINLSDISDDKFVDQSFFANNSKSFYDLIERINFIRLNPDVKNILINTNNMNIGLSKVEEIRKEMIRLQESGKSVIVYGDNFDNTKYILANQADDIVMPPSYSSRIDIKGYYKNNLFFKNILSKYGVDFEVINTGDYKTFGEEYSKSKLSKESRENKERILDKKLDFFVNSIKDKFNVDKETLTKEILDGNFALLNIDQAEDRGLVTTALSYDDYLNEYDFFKENTIDIFDIKLSGKNTFNNEIAIITLEGEILEQSKGVDYFISIQNFKEKLDKIRVNPNVKALIIRINSPGGDAYQAELIYNEIIKFKEEKNIPVYASISDVAASGGYYIAIAADEIYANETSLTGSIGVVTMLPKFYNTLNKYDINNEVISKGKYTGLYNPLYKLTDDDREIIRSSLLDIYSAFVDRVSESRKLDKILIYQHIAQGRLWLGNEAKEIGLVNDNLSLNELISLIASKQFNNKAYNVVEYNSTFDLDGVLYKVKDYLYTNNTITDTLYNQFTKLQNMSYKPLYYSFDAYDLMY